MLAAQPGPDLAGALAGERRAGQHLTDQPHQLLVACRRHWTVAAWLVASTAAGIDRGAGRAQHPAPHREGQAVLHGYLGRFAGGIWSPRFSAAAPSTSCSRVSWPILGSACFSARSSGDWTTRWPLRPCLPAARKSSRQAATGAPRPSARATAPPRAHRAAI